MDRYTFVAIGCMLVLGWTLWSGSYHIDGALYDLRYPSPHFAVQPAGEALAVGTHLQGEKVVIVTEHARGDSAHSNGRDVLLILDLAGAALPGAMRINGRPWPDDDAVTLALGNAEHTRLRVVNLTPHRIGIRTRDNRKMRLIEVDALEKDEPVEAQVMSPRQRLSFQVDARHLPLALRVVGEAETRGGGLGDPQPQPAHTQSV